MWKLVYVVPAEARRCCQIPCSHSMWMLGTELMTSRRSASTLHSTISLALVFFFFKKKRTYQLWKRGAVLGPTVSNIQANIKSSCKWLSRGRCLPLTCDYLSWIRESTHMRLGWQSYSLTFTFTVLIPSERSEEEKAVQQSSSLSARHQSRAEHTVPSYLELHGALHPQTLSHSKSFLHEIASC